MEYAFIQNHSQQLNLKALCRLLKVSRSSHYGWLQQQQRIRQRQQRQTEFDQEVARLFAKNKGCDGARRLQRQLLAQGFKGFTCNRKTVAASPHRQGLVAKAARKFKATPHSKHNLPVFDNLLNQDFSATATNQKWAGDITYRVPGVRHQQGR